MVSVRFIYMSSGLLALLFVFYYTCAPYFHVFGRNASSDITHGIYSGTFDPPTKAHNAIIRKSIEKLGLKKLYIFVNKDNTKNCKCGINERVEMLKRMLADVHDKVIIIPQVSDNKHDDFLKIQNMIRGKCVLITGEDSYKKRLLLPVSKRAQVDAICVVPRELEGKTPISQLEPHAFFLDFDMEQDVASLSSTKARKKLARQNYTSAGLIPEVLSYILNNSLYSGERKREVAYHV